MKIKKYLHHFNFNRYRVIHGIKTAIGCLIGVAIEKYYDLPSGQWIPITVMVVMSAQTHFGGALRKAYMRFLGTISGILTTITVLYFFGYNILVIFIAVFVMCVIFTYVASSNGDISYVGTLGGVTMLLTLTGQQATVEVVMQRGFYIVVGIIIALLVSRFIFPIHARNRLRYHVATTLRNLQKIYHKTIQEEREEVDTKLEGVVASDIYFDQPRLISEAASGSLIFAANKIFFTKIVNSEHQLNRLINLMHLSLCDGRWVVATDLHTVIEDNLSYLADCFENMKQPQIMIDFSDAVNEIAQLVEKNQKNNKNFKISTEYSFVFFLEQILKELENMRQLIVKVNGKDNKYMV